MHRFGKLIATGLTVVFAITVSWATAAHAVAGPDEFDFLELLNQERHTEGLDALGMVPTLHDMAEDWSGQMSSSDTLSHRPGQQQVEWVERHTTTDWLRIGENVGYGYSISSLHSAFMNSPGHRANVLGDYTHVGVGVVVEESGRIWVTFNFVKTNQHLQAVGTPQVAPAPTPPTLLRTTQLHAIRPGRLFDSRHDLSTKPSAGQRIDVQVAGQFDVPADTSRVAAAALNVTVIDPGGPGYVTVWASKAPRPGSSNLNPQRPGQIIANQVISPVGRDGKVSIFTSTPAHVLVDIAGWYEPAEEASSGRFDDVDPARLFDSRERHGDRRPAGSTTELAVTGVGGVPPTGVSAVSVNITVTAAEGMGYVTAWGGGSKPLASNLNTDTPGQTIANQVFVPVSEQGTIKVFNSMATHLIVDVTGFFTDETAAVDDSGLFVPVNPYRAVDTRDYLVRSRMAGTWDLDLQGDGWRAAALNVTIVDAAGLGYATVWGGGNKPPTSTVNADRAGQTIPNAATVNGAGDSAIRIYTNQETDVLIDVNGFYVR